MGDVKESSISKMLHALGIEYVGRKNTLIEPGRRYNPTPCSYRNYYQTEDDAEWNELVEKEFAIKSKSIGMNYYFVTTKGKDFLKDLGYKFKER